MWEFLGIIIDQLSETVKWFFTGFLITIVLLILLYKNNLLSKKGSLGFIKKISYYLFFPIYIGIISWFTSATFIVEKDATELAKITIEKAEKSIFPQFSKYILSLAEDWIDGELGTKEELVDSYLKKYDYEEGSITTTALEWTLINGIEYLENKAIENGNLQVGDENVNFSLLLSNYLSSESGITKMPFNYLKGLSIKMIHQYTRSFYIIYFWMFMLVILILTLDIYFTLKNRNKAKDTNFINPSKTVENNHQKLENPVEELDTIKKLK